ncbi:response regulator [Marivibrio halodurans]|uniref:Response regulator n=1 Tax=Marivibrio halodurans TaxID=2039722 RepID=A0A8J7S0E1_9PROT|nr:response regulator [Marivibrio halodurans]MBP5857590.1 response regulator [Marivibrio halodurans]
MAYDLGKLGFLVVEDNVPMRHLVRQMLQAFGVKRIADASEGHGAFRVLESADFDIALVDYLMAPMDGVTFTRLLRTERTSPNPYLPVIMMTGYTERERVIEARDAGVTELISKPLSARGLYHHITAVIEYPRPYVRAPGFFGPDRRRRQMSFAGPERRRGTPIKGARYPGRPDYLDV